ncbi:Neprosin domain-containing protein [Dioscorea alata]|uniref:Neprosin domain-containing protein n=1 Tax=Dioscorea alata TaxID=55571 RepID=A0ACB7UDX5_DIOAL|nr:Neprosin domain-containing protein [Dioscorea alata]
MLKMMVLVFIFLCCLLLLLPSFGFTIDEDLELLNKPTMKTTIVHDGNIYDCVGINKQPAFDHPSLKNHKIQLRPSSYPVGLFDDNSSSSSTNRTTSIEIGLPDGGCPSGTVPIRRLTKENLTRMKLSLKNMRIKNTPMYNDTNEELHHQISNDSYGDTKTRLTTAWTNDDFKSTGCVNYACPGFVQVSKDTPLGIAISPVSTYNGTQRAIELFVFRDPATLNWWFLCGPDKKLVGYWPNSLFTTLAQYGTRLEFGGTAGYTCNTVFPPMGSGHFPDEGYSKSCLFQMVKYIDGDSRSDDLPLLEGAPYSNSPCYKAGDFTESGNKDNYFYFGGPEHNLTIDEDFEIEKQLKLLNKPAIKTIVENGDIFDCVDINKQPAFDHPSLKDHQIQLRPSSLPVGLCDNDKIKSLSGINSMEVGLQESCPSGTVPIKRVKKGQLIGMRSSFKQYKIRPSSSNVNDDASNQRWATMHTPLRPEYQHWYFGASGFVSVYGFPEMLETQASSSVFWVANDDDLNKINHIVVGWLVHPTNNGDKNTRLVAGWTSDNFQSTGCMNSACPGFVQVSKDLPLDITINPVSTYNGTQYSIELYVFRDPVTTNWWFLFGPDKKVVGYWPNKLFTTLAQYATRLEFGGIAEHTSKCNAAFPPIGSGHFPDEGYGKSCLFQMVKFIDINSQSNDLSLFDTTPYSDSSCYKVGDLTKSRNTGNYFYFGGPGGIDC